MPLGLYISVPFCKTKCTYCNFASDVFSRAAFHRYVDRVCADIEHAAETAEQIGGQLDRTVDTIYLGGGTPTVLDISHLERLFVTISQNFEVTTGAEITVECAPGTLTPATLESFSRIGVNRVSLGIQSFVDQEARAVGRLHTRAIVLDDIARLRDAGISNINVDLIAGLPHQNAESWECSLQEAIASEVPHVSVYMLEVDEDSRLGRELIAGGTKYHAHFVPDDDLTADLYDAACERLGSAGIRQYEISNFARDGFESRHNLKYWTRRPYMGFGVDAHSMLYTEAKALKDSSPIVGLKAHASTVAQADMEPAAMQKMVVQTADALPFTIAASSTVEGHGFSRTLKRADEPGFSTCGVRFATPDSLEGYLTDSGRMPTLISEQAALEESMFLGLRLNRGVNLLEVATRFDQSAVANLAPILAELIESGLLERIGDVVRLTPRGRLLSNEVFERFLGVPA